MVVTSELNPLVQLSYKQTDLCETTPGVKSFSGYVHLPQSALTDLSVDFDIHTFFWFFEARKDAQSAPLVVYLAGGPGESSTYVAMSSEGGPCFVNMDVSGTTLNPWSMNNHANVLYIDQPVGAGFSYTSLVPATYTLDNIVTPLSEYGDNVPEVNATLGQGTYSNPAVWATTNTTISSSKALGHFFEHWLTQFPEYPSSNKNIGIWGNSYGGYWAPASAAVLDKKIKESATDSPLRQWTVDNVGVTNGVIDILNDMPFLPEYAFNNTYQPMIPEEVYLSAQGNFSREGGCRDLITQCQAAAREGDSEGAGTNETVNTACRAANIDCFRDVGSTIAFGGVSAFDIAVNLTSEGSDPCPFYLPVQLFLNRELAQKALGVPLNFTYISQTALRAYNLDLPAQPTLGTGDLMRGTKSNLEYALQNDIKVALVYGDRDARCPWIGAENAALNANYSGSTSFNQAGYQFITTNSSYQGGLVKQFGKFSFSRVFQSGHAVNAYQPETVDQIFSRVISGKDIATGEQDVDDQYSTSGPGSSFSLVQETLPQTPGTCMVFGAFQDVSVWSMLADSTSDDGQSSSNSTGTDNGSSSGSGNGTGTGNSTGSASENASSKVQGGSCSALLFFLSVAFYQLL